MFNWKICSEFSFVKVVANAAFLDFPKYMSPTKQEKRKFGKYLHC